MKLFILSKDGFHEFHSRKEYKVLKIMRIINYISKPFFVKKENVEKVAYIKWSLRAEAEA